jgi:hypothetical protein
MIWGTYDNPSGPWQGFYKAQAYLGLRFIIKGKEHYGWAGVYINAYNYPTTIVATLEGFAYETIPHKPIAAGKTHGSDGAEAVSERPADSTTSRTTAPEPATLGALALGSPGLSIWRREESCA